MIMIMDTQKALPTKDWHPADVKAALEKRSVSLRQLARKHGYSHFQRVLTSPWWAAEQIVAKALGVPPQQIWPSRYAGETSRERAQRMTRNIRVTKRGQIVVQEAQR